MKRLIVAIMLLCMIGGVYAIPQGPSIEVSLLNQDPDPAIAGGIADLRFVAENVGSEDIKNVIFEIQPEYPFTLQGEAQRFPGQLYAGQVDEEAYVLFYKVQVASDVPEGEYDIRLRYSADGGDNWRRLEPFSIRVETLDPVLAVTNVDSETIAPGQETSLKITLENMAATTIKNVRLSLGLREELQGTAGTSISELPFSPTDSSNEKVIEQMNANSQRIVDFNLKADADAESKVYKVPLEISYSDHKGNEYTRQQIVSLQVGETPNLLVKLDYTEPFIVGTGPKELAVRIVNRGSEDVKYLTARLAESEQYDILSSDEVYVGNIDSDDYETAEFRVSCNECGDLPMKVYVSYRDSNNNPYEEEYELSKKVYSQEEAEQAGLTQSNNYTGIIIVVLIVIVGFIAYRYFRKKKNVS